MIFIGCYNEFKLFYKEWIVFSFINKIKWEKECYKIFVCDWKSGIIDLCGEGILNDEGLCEVIGVIGNKKKELGFFLESYVIISVLCVLYFNKFLFIGK